MEKNKKIDLNQIKIDFDQTKNVQEKLKENKEIEDLEKKRAEIAQECSALIDIVKYENGKWLVGGYTPEDYKSFFVKRDDDYMRGR